MVMNMTLSSLHSRYFSPVYLRNAESVALPQFAQSLKKQFSASIAAGPGEVVKKKEEEEKPLFASSSFFSFPLPLLIICSSSSLGGGGSLEGRKEGYYDLLRRRVLRSKKL